jgi:hypothetical protein
VKVCIRDGPGGDCEVKLIHSSKVWQNEAQSLSLKKYR